MIMPTAGLQLDRVGARELPAERLEFEQHLLIKLTFMPPAIPVQVIPLPAQAGHQGAGRPPAAVPEAA